VLPKFEISSPRRVFLPSLAILFSSIWIFWNFDHALSSNNYRFKLIFIVIFLMLVWQIVLSWLEKPVTLNRRQQAEINKLKVTLNVPVYNESPDILDRTIASIFKQKRLPNRVQVVDDGSTVDYSQIKKRWMAKVPKGVKFSWVRQENKGKRYAQMKSFKNDKADIFITIDSDTALTPDAISEGLKPFIDPRVMSVAGLVLSFNKHHNLAVKSLDLVTHVFQVTTRSALSIFGSVLVNSGALAFYRAEVIRKAANGYLNEKFFGQEVRISDDSQLTLYALSNGRAVQQISSIAITTWPESLGHIIRQQLRWYRGGIIRSIWRLRYLPLNSLGFWFELFGWGQYILIWFVTVYILMHFREYGHQVLASLLITSLLASYIVTLRTLSIKRSDETLWRQLGVYLLSPMIIVWGWLVYRPIRLYALLTCMKSGWGTRKEIEVELT
jgi:hyaluronan synthase